MDEDCSRTQPLLPWLLNRTLSNEQTVATLDHVRHCQACRQELVALVVIRDASAIVWEPQEMPSFSDALWSSVERAVESEYVASPIPSRWVIGTWKLLTYVTSPFGLVRDAVHLAWRSTVSGMLDVLAPDTGH